MLEAQIFTHICTTAGTSYVICQVQKRFDLRAEYHDMVDCINPKNASALHPTSLAPIIERLPYLNDIIQVNELDREWRQHALEDVQEVEDEDKDAATAWNGYWSKIKDLRKPNGEKKYGNLITFAAFMAFFPCSNAPVERVFSSLKLIKNAKKIFYEV